MAGAWLRDADTRARAIFGALEAMNKSTDSNRPWQIAFGKKNSSEVDGADKLGSPQCQHK
jgi:hypothetical protein